MDAVDGEGFFQAALLIGESFICVDKGAGKRLGQLFNFAVGLGDCLVGADFERLGAPALPGRRRRRG